MLQQISAHQGTTKVASKSTSEGSCDTWKTTRSSVLFENRLTICITACLKQQPVHPPKKMTTANPLWWTGRETIWCRTLAENFLKMDREESEWGIGGGGGGQQGNEGPSWYISWTCRPATHFLRHLANSQSWCSLLIVNFRPFGPFPLVSNFYALQCGRTGVSSQ